MKENNRMMNVEHYRTLKVIKESLEYKLILESDTEKKKRIKKELLNLKLHLKILKQGLKILNKRIEYEVIYLSYFKENWQFKSISEIADYLYVSIDTVYKARLSGRRKFEQYFRYIDIEDREIVDISEKLRLEREYQRLKRKEGGNRSKKQKNKNKRKEKLS